MNNVECIKNSFSGMYKDNGPENGILQGMKYSGRATHCRACLNAIVRIIKPVTILEVGSWHYDSTISMSNAMDTYLSEDKGLINSFDIKCGGYDGLGISTNLPKRIKPLYWYPYKTDYDDWKFSDPSIVHRDFIDYTNDELFAKNEDILKSVTPDTGYDLIFLDGDHSYEGVKKDWEHVLKYTHKDTVIVIDNIWDERLREVRRFFDSLDTTKWDFESWNDENLNMVQDTGITLAYKDIK
jgi:hypothetical protein